MLQNTSIGWYCYFIWLYACGTTEKIFVYFYPTHLVELFAVWTFGVIFNLILKVILLYFAQWLVQKSPTTLSNNLMQQFGYSRVSVPHVVCLWCLGLLWLVVVLNVFFCFMTLNPKLLSFKIFYYQDFLFCNGQPLRPLIKILCKVQILLNYFDY